MKIVALAGGVGGSKLAFGLSRLLKTDEFTIIVNTGDDFRYLGLYVCPDLDTVTYSISGKNNPLTGWGRNDETWNVHEELLKLGEPAWFNLGDKDLALHLYRTKLLAEGMSLTDVTSILCRSLGVTHPILPMTDSPITTRVFTSGQNNLSFQEYFVREKCVPVIDRIEFMGIEKAFLTEKIIYEISSCSFVVICPSNPFVSIDPILSLTGMKELLSTKTVIGVSPLVAKKAIKGPLEKMCLEFGFTPGSATIAKHYGEILRGLVIDKQDGGDVKEITQFGIIPLVANTLMTDSKSKIELAKEVILFGKELLEE